MKGLVEIAYALLWGGKIDINDFRIVRGGLGRPFLPG